MPQPIESCTQRDVELSINQIWVVSSSAPQLPLQIEDASRPEKNDVIIQISKLIFELIIGNKYILGS